jgi:hypothetical protein
MNLTNKFNLPDIYCEAVQIFESDYDRGDSDFTASQLPRPAYLDSLLREHWDTLTEDVSDRIWALSGQVGHLIFERVAKKYPERYIAEQRWFTNLKGHRISGRGDCLDLSTGVLWDWKRTSVWKFILGDLEEWTAQANVNAYCARMNGHTIKALKNLVELKDHKVRLARITRREDYPPSPVHVCPLELWSIGQAQDYILLRATAHESKSPPLCTKKERWQRDAEYAVMKKGRASAIRKYSSHDQAWAVLQECEKKAKPWEKGKYFLEERQSEPVRCLDFCPVKAVCQFGQEAKKKWKDKQE